MTAGDIRRTVVGQVLIADTETMEVVREYTEECVGEGHLIIRRSVGLSGETTVAQVIGPDTGEAAVCLPCQWERTRCAVVRIREILDSAEAEKGNKGEKGGTRLFIPPSWGRDEPHH